MKTPLIIGVQGDLFDKTPANTKHQLKYEKVDRNTMLDIIDPIQSPILTFSLQWKDSIPKRILSVITEARLIAALKREELATIEECFVYIYTRTLDGPMDHEWTDIYMHIGCKIFEKWFAEDRWEEMEAPRELSDWLNSQLTGLRRWIYNRRRKMLKEYSICKKSEVDR